MKMKLTAVFEKVPEGYIAFVEELPGANTQAATLEEARRNLKEALRLVLEANRTLAEESLKGQMVIREPLLIQDRRSAVSWSAICSVMAAFCFVRKEITRST